jgi:hypothetical protein
VSAAQPISVRLRAYRVGFGDCLLLTVRYAGRKRDAHLLIDFGTRSTALKGPTMTRIAQQIAEDCAGRLDVLVATHRHQDHIGGFGNQGALAALGDLRPRLVVRPWTDVPTDDPPDHLRLGAESLGFVSLLDKVGERSDEVARAFAADRTTTGKETRSSAALGVSNPAALETLGQWGAGNRTAWVKAGTTLDLGLTGVDVQVLGPPTLDQVPGLRHYASSSSEYWLGLTDDGSIQDHLVPPKEPAQDGAVVSEPDGFGSASWLLEKLARGSSRQVLGIVEGFEQVLNNTSVILLVTVGARTLLLSGDAQVENWSFTLDRALASTKPDLRLRRALADVDLYKVGHHGSRNATPKRLYGLWTDQRRAGHPLTSVLSTRRDVFKGSSAATRVPQGKLVAALQRIGEVHSTDALASGVGWFDLEAPTAPETATFEYTPGPRLA